MSGETTINPRKPAPDLAFASPPSVSVNQAPFGAGETEERSSKSRKCLPSAEGFLFAALGPRGCAPLGTPAGVPPAPHALQAPPAACRGPLAEGRGAGEERPRHPAGRLGSLRSRQGAVSSPYGAAGRTNPLTRPSLEKRARGPRRGLEGHCRSGWGSRLAQRPRSGLALTPRNDPNLRLVAGGALPPAACHVANAPGGRRRALLPLIFASEVWGFRGGTPPGPGLKGTDQAKRREGPLCILALDLSTTNEVCVSAPLPCFGDWYGGTL